MKLEVFERKTGLRLGMIKTYDFVQYNDVFNGVGDFTINIPYTEEAFPILTRGNYILFEKEDMGIIEYRHRSIDNESIVIVKGHMLNKMLDYRVFDKTFRVVGTLKEVCETAIETYFTNPTDLKRRIDFVSFGDNATITDSESIVFQRTGDNVGIGISDLLGTKLYGYKLIPQITNYNESDEKPTNVSTMEFNILKPTDRTQGNSEGNPPITFSLELRNLQRLEYLEDSSEYCSTAIVAGAGEGSDRVVIETGDLEAEGLDRIELYVDARDLQKEDLETGEVLTDDEYNKALKLRGDSRLEEHKAFESFSGQIIDGDFSYTYGKDFKNGDFVSLIDKQLNMSVVAQITLVKHSGTQEGDKLDLTFGYKKDSVRQLLKKRSVI